MSLAGWFEISLTLALVLAAAYPIGGFMANVFENRTTSLTPLLAPIERAPITALQYLPALALGPVAEQFLAAHGATF